MMPKQVRDEVGPHDVTTHPNHDVDYRLRVALRYPSIRIAEPLYYWRYHPLSLSGRIKWSDLARDGAPIRIKLGVSSPSQARKELAALDIAEAFEFYQAGEYRPVARLVLLGVSRDTRYLSNRGVWSILIRSILPWTRHRAQREKQSNAAPAPL